MKKQMMSLALALVMCLSLCVPAFASEVDIMSAEDMKNITTAYATELSKIAQEKNVPMDSINQTTVPIIVDSAATVHYGQQSYANMVSDIALACSKYERLNSPQGKNILRGQGRVENYTSYVKLSARYLYGEELDRMDVAHSSTLSRSFTITIGSGTKIEAVTLNVGFSKSVSYTMSGPSNGTKLGNGMLATHNVAFGVIYGTLIHEDYDYVDNESGTRYHFSQNIVDSNTASTTQYTVPAAFASSGVYIQHAVSAGTVRSFSNESAFHTKLAKNPTYFF